MLDETLKRSWPARLAAVGFVIVILAGNGWFVYGFTGNQVPDLVSGSFSLGILMSLSGGLGLAALAIKRRISGVDTSEGED